MCLKWQLNNAIKTRPSQMSLCRYLLSDIALPALSHLIRGDWFYPEKIIFFMLFTSSQNILNTQKNKNPMLAAQNNPCICDAFWWLVNSYLGYCTNLEPKNCKISLFIPAVLQVWIPSHPFLLPHAKYLQTIRGTVRSVPHYGMMRDGAPWNAPWILENV